MSKKAKYLTGQKFGYWYILGIGELETSNFKTKYLCECICGERKIIKGSKLRGKYTKSCGCKKTILREITTKPGEAGFTILKKRYQTGAKTRSLVFELNDEDLNLLFKQDCYFCGSKPNQIAFYRSYTRHKYSDAGIKNSEYIYNGIDRLNNSLGYTKENCVTCCKLCNKFKGILTTDDFINHAKQIAKFWDNKCKK